MFLKIIPPKSDDTQKVIEYVEQLSMQSRTSEAKAVSKLMRLVDYGFGVFMGILLFTYPAIGSESFALAMTLVAVSFVMMSVCQFVAERLSSILELFDDKRKLSELLKDE